ncbi:MAG: maleylpyruvate isomerase family mycothiol-dependent enzyme [Chloroflexota bacterium]
MAGELPRIDVVPLFPEERAALLEVLRSLTPEQWALPTSCPGWSVQDIAAHLVADDLGRLSWQRDGAPGSVFQPTSAESFETDLRDFINRQNNLWVDTMRRFSAQVVLGMLEWTGPSTQKHFESLEPDAPGLPVSWAGESESPNWFDLAREYSERWIHQAQIREAVGAPMLYEMRLFQPLIATMVRALPHTLRTLDAKDGAHIRIVVPTVRTAWSLVREGGRWQLVQPLPTLADATVELDGDTAWRVFTKNISPANAKTRAKITGDEALGMRVLHAVAIVA